MVRFERAEGRCEQCGRPHGRTVLHLGDGRWWDAEAAQWRNGRGRALRRLPSPDRWNGPIFTTRVILACAHLDHNPANSRPGNLKALCQRCHLVHDRPEHRRRRWATFRSRKATGDLFAG